MVADNNPTLDRQTATTQLFEYDFAVDGGAVGNITLRGGTIPSGAIIVGSTLDQSTAFTGGAGATVKVTCESDGDVQGGPMDIATYSAIILATSLAGVAGCNGALVDVGFVNGLVSLIRTTASRSLVMTVGTNALTAGKFSLWLTYLQ